MIFQFPEVGQDIIPTPARIPGGAPIVEIRPMSTHIDHGVDGARAANDFATRPVSPTLVQLRIGFRLVHPVKAWVCERPPVTDRHPDPRTAIRTACLQEQNAVASGLGQTMRQNATRGSRADDDVVVLPHGDAMIDA